MIKKLIITLIVFVSACTNSPSINNIQTATQPSIVRDTYGLGAIENIKKGNKINSSWHFLPISAGDKLQIDIVNYDELSGIYEVGFDGFLQIPFIEPIKAVNQSAKILEQLIKDTLVKQKVMIANATKVSVRIKQYAAIRVVVKGGVFSPGEVIVNTRPVEQITLKDNDITGDNAQKRMLSTALKAASGITPYADLENIILNRDGKISRYDLSGIFTGKVIHNVPLVQNDIIIVPTLNIIQEEYVRPSSITPPGFEIIISNINSGTKTKNSVQTQVALTYGSTLLHAAQTGGCVGGGTYSSNSKIMLISQDLNTKKFKPNLVQSVDNLLAHKNNRKFNPYLTKFDSVACFDSSVSNFREAFRFLTDIIQPIYLYKNF